MTTILITGFEPFGGDTSNPSGAVVTALAAHWTRPETLVTEVLPVTFRGARERMEHLLQAHSPDLVIATGVAGERRIVTVERTATNRLNARIPDNAGDQPHDADGFLGAAATRAATLPVDHVVSALQAAGIAAAPSDDAGGFVCNHTLYTALHAAPRETTVGFIHLPWSSVDERGTAQSPTPADLARALETAVIACLDGG